MILIISESSAWKFDLTTTNKVVFSDIDMAKERTVHIKKHPVSHALILSQSTWLALLLHPAELLPEVIN